MSIYSVSSSTITLVSTHKSAPVTKYYEAAFGNLSSTYGLGGFTVPAVKSTKATAVQITPCPQRDNLNIFRRVFSFSSSKRRTSSTTSLSTSSFVPVSKPTASQYEVTFGTLSSTYGYQGMCVPHPTKSTKAQGASRRKVLGLPKAHGTYPNPTTELLISYR